MINDLKKRDCDIKIKLTPSGTQFLHFEMDIQGDHLEFLPASTMGEQFGAIVNALYTLFSEIHAGYYDAHEESDAHCQTLCTNGYVIHTKIAKVEWDNEGCEIEIVMSRKVDNNVEYENDTIELEVKSYDDVLKKYTVKTIDLCYAVAKACTEVLKEYGFYGYKCSTEYDTFKIHQLLYIKSYALLNFEARELMIKEKNEYARKTSFEKEIELLLFDM